MSLVQPYDGGGWAIPDPDSIAVLIQGGVQATGTVLIFPELSRDSYIRVLSAGYRIVSGTPVFPVINLVVVGRGGIGPTVNFGRTEAPSAVNIRDSFRDTPPVVPPGYAMVGSWQNGQADTQVEFQFLLLEVPVGTVFYL